MNQFDEVSKSFLESVNNFVYFWKSFSVWNAYLNKHGIQGILASSKSTMCSFFELVIVF